eukprot:TRINITY_DN533_c0_g1_i29.p1 TRINITY_DN533_c0_g1~~TRINITY_DN533_c0_g1_i29.p1  ORF type:complete len:1521 (-),score=401.49 TRINITY_DN533_c0_g1_i29:642-5204(-)
MDRNQEARRGAMAATVNGLSRRRQRNSSGFKDSPEEDGAAELHETTRLRDRGSKKERDRDRDRSSRSKRQRGGERLLHESNREEEGEESTEESVDDEEEEEEYEDAAQFHHRKSFPTKAVKPILPWKVPDEMTVPRKARSVSAKRSHECWISGGGSNGREPIPRQASTSPARPSAVGPVPEAPVAPPSSNASARKKMKLIRTKNRPPKVSNGASIQESEIEIEIAEVLFRMTRQVQSPSKQESASSQKFKSRDSIGSSIDAKSGESSSIAISQTAIDQSSVLQQNSNPSAIAPMRKRPRPHKSEEEIPATASFTALDASYAAKIEADQSAKVGISSPKSDTHMFAAVENGCGSVSVDLGSSLPPEMPQDSVKTESTLVAESDDPDGQFGIGTRDKTVLPAEETPCAKVEDPDLEDTKTTKMEAPSIASADYPQEEKFKIDLMAPPSEKSSPLRDEIPDLEKPLALDAEPVPKEEIMKADEEKEEQIVEEGEVGLTEKTGTIAKELKSEKQMIDEWIPDLKLDVEKQVKKQPIKGTINEPKAEKPVQPAALPPQMTVASWSGRLPFGHMGPIPPHLPAVVARDGSSIIVQPQPKRCATHCHIAQYINYHRQFARPNPFWPGIAGSASLLGTKPENIIDVPPTESVTSGNPLQGSSFGKDLSFMQDKGPGAIVGHTMKDKSSPAIFTDIDQRKRLILQQVPQPASTNNISAPAFLYPLNQQQPAPVTQSRAVESVTNTGNAASSSSSSDSIAGSAASSVSTSATTVSFNYANVPTNEAQYFAMLQSNGYPFPLPAHIGAPPLYKGSHHPVVPFFSGPFYPPQMLHPSQLQHLQQPQSHSTAVQPGKHNTSKSSGSSQKHQQQQQLQGCIGNTGGGISHGFPNLKQCQQVQQNYLPPPHSRQLESEIGNDHRPSTADSRVSHAQKSVFSHNFTMPIPPQNFTIMTPAALGGGNQSEKQQQQQSLKGGMELNHSQAFALSFATLDGAAASAATPASGLDFSSMAQNHVVFQSLPESARRWYQITPSAASSQAANEKNYLIKEEGKSFSDSIISSASREDERKMVTKAATSTSKSLTFSRPENDASVSTILGNSMVDSSSRTLNDISASGNSSRPPSRSGAPLPSTTTVTSNSQHHHQEQHPIQLQQQLQQKLAGRMKSGLNSANVCSDQITSAMAKFPNAVSFLPQAFAQGSSPPQSAQWKASAKAGTTPIPSSQASTQFAKSFFPQQQNRIQLCVPAAGQTQISFGVNAKLSTAGQQFPSSNNLFPSSTGGFVGSPPPSMSKSAGSSPNTTTCSKTGPNTIAMPSQPTKNTPSSSSCKSLPLNVGHVPSILGNSSVNAPRSSSVKPQQQLLQNQHQQQQQHQSQKHFQQSQPHFQQSQPIFSNFYMQTQPSQATTTSTTSGYYQKRQSEQHQQQQNLSAVSSTGMFSLCPPPVKFSGPATSEPMKATAAAAANNLKGLPPQGFLHAPQFSNQSAGNLHLLMSATIPYIHSVPVGLVQSAEQKPAAVSWSGNDNLHPSWQPERG